MTKKDYELIAKVISLFLDNGDNDQIDGIAGVEIITRQLANIFALANDRFNEEKFLLACGLEY